MSLLETFFGYFLVYNCKNVISKVKMSKKVIFVTIVSFWYWKHHEFGLQMTEFSILNPVLNSILNLVLSLSQYGPIVEWPISVLHYRASNLLNYIFFTVKERIIARLTTFFHDETIVLLNTEKKTWWKKLF